MELKNRAAMLQVPEADLIKELGLARRELAEALTISIKMGSFP
jgi:hypothetical protein